MEHLIYVFIRMWHNPNTSTGQDTDYTPTDTQNSDINTHIRGNSTAKLRNYTLGQYGGSDWRALTINEMPSHNHSHNLNRSHGTNGGGSNNMFHRARSSLTGGSGITINNTGSDWGHGILPPYYVLTYIMKL
jgi:microcystin-dependent protein